MWAPRQISLARECTKDLIVANALRPTSTALRKNAQLLRKLYNMSKMALDFGADLHYVG
jgi:hypothetical protein